MTVSYVDDRETFFTPHTPDKDTAMPTHLMTAQYVDELVYKQPGLAVVDKDGDTWGWVIDRHKGETGWVVGDTHDDRMQALRDGARVQPQLPPDCERYEFAQETTETTCAATYPTPTADDSDDDWTDCEPHRLAAVVRSCAQLDGDEPTGEFTDPLEGSIHTPASFTEGMEAHISDPVGDPINPNYYRFPSGAEVIDITENLTSNGGQVVQYVARSTRIDGKNKGDQAENLRKAIWFLRRELSRIEAQK